MHFCLPGGTIIRLYGVDARGVIQMLMQRAVQASYSERSVRGYERTACLPGGIRNLEAIQSALLPPGIPGKTRRAWSRLDRQTNCLPDAASVRRRPPPALQGDSWH